MRNIKIREAVLADSEGIARVHVDCWRTTYKGIFPQSLLENLSYSKRAKLWESNICTDNVYVALNGKDEVVGFSSGGPERSETYEHYQGELYAIYLLKEYQGKGIGKLLFENLIKKLRMMEINTLIVWVLEKNDSCLFYEALGGERIDSKELKVGEKKLKEIAYGWSSLKSIYTDL